MRRRSGMTERGCREEFNTRTGINGFPSSLSQPIPTADSEAKREAGKGEGKIHAPSASNAVCDDDCADKNPGVLHVQGGLAEQGVYHLQTVCYANWCSRPSDANMLLKQMSVSDTPAFL